MRLFVALNFNYQVKDYLTEVQNIIKLCAKSGNYTKYDNFHLTLRFLGEIPEHQVDDICDILDIVSKKVKPFTFTIGGINSFIRKDKHLVYVDVLTNKDKLNLLAKSLNSLIDKIFPELKPYNFKPHITIAREVMFTESSALISIQPFKENITVNEISLMESSRNKVYGLTYTPIYTVKLQE